MQLQEAVTIKFFCVPGHGSIPNTELLALIEQNLLNRQSFSITGIVLVASQEDFAKLKHPPVGVP